MKIYKLLTILSVFVLAACKKEPLPELPESNDPYYMIRGLVNGDSINWTVGLDDITLSHGVSEMNGVESFYGQINSPFEGMAVRIDVLRPERFFTGSEVSAIPSDELPFLVHRPGSIKFNFGMNYSQFNYLLVKDETNNFVVMDKVPFDEFGMYTVDLKFTDYGPESFSIPIKYGFENQELIAGFTSAGDGTNLVVTPLTPTGSHKWYIDGNLVSEEPTLIYPIQNGIYTVTHKITDQYHNEAEHTTLVRFKENSFYWQLKYHYVPPMQPSSHYGNVIVSMLKNGQWYSTTVDSENLSNKFLVSNIETILDNDFDPLWTIFDFSFRASLYNENQTDSLYLPEMVGTVNVALQ